MKWKLGVGRNHTGWLRQKGSGPLLPLHLITFSVSAKKKWSVPSKLNSPYFSQPGNNQEVLNYFFLLANFIQSLFFFVLFWTFYFTLEYSRLTMLQQVQVLSRVTQPYIFMYPFCSKLPSHPGCHVTLSRGPCETYRVPSRTLLVIHLKYSSVCMFIPNFPTIPSPTLPLDNSHFSFSTMFQALC